MTSEQPASEPNKKIRTGTRAALAVLTFSLLAMALSSSCNPTDSTRDGSKSAPPQPAATAAAGTNAPARQPTSPSSPPAQSLPTPLPEEMFNAALTSLDGKSLHLSDYKGKVVILNLWATWCGPCQREIPDFIEIQEDYKGRGLQVVGITSEDERNTLESVKEFVKKFKINYDVVLIDEGGWASFLAPRYSIPQTYVLDQNGQLLQKFVGYSPQVAVMARNIADRALNDAANGGRTDETAK